jgi:serine/threonine protein kinase/tetratricopeptide (TPR) repeat protein
MGARHVCPSAPISNPAPPPEPGVARGTSLGRFVILGLVGRGAMGEVYGAYDPELDRKVAIKLVRARAGDAAESRARLMREAQATAKVSHPNVVTVYDAGTFQERVFIAMEFVEGHTLRYWLQARSRTWPEVVEIFTAAGRGLAAAHEKELVHRDFKPDNVMVGSDGQVRVMDFGLARVGASRATSSGPSVRDVVLRETEGPRLPPRAPLSRGDDEDLEATRELGTAQLMSTAGGTTGVVLTNEITQTGTVLGTPAYMSPEQFRRDPTDARSDQFSFCVALYESVYGARPFLGRTIDELAESVTAGRLSDAPPDSKVPAWLRKVLMRGLAVHPADRYPTMNELLAELDNKPAVAHRLGFAVGAADKLAGVWEAPVAGHPVETAPKLEIRQAFSASGKLYAAASFTSASAVLDRYAERWTSLYVEVCEATHVRGEQSAEVLDLRMACLQEGLDDLKALCRLFREATPEVVENAVSAANALGTLERCQDVKLLRAIVRPPEDPATRAAVERLRGRLVEVRALMRVGRVVAGLEEAETLVEEARRVGYGPMLAEALLVLGDLQVENSKTDAAVPTMDEAVWTAELARHDEVAAKAASVLVYLQGYVDSRFDAAEIWSRHAETLLRRMGGHDQLWGWLFNNRATMRLSQGRLTEALADHRLGIAAKERALGPDHPDLGGSLGNIAEVLTSLGDYAQALENTQRAVEIIQAGLGPDHPRAAIVLSNCGEQLCRLGRFAEARAVAERSLQIFERETDPNGTFVTYPLLTMGLSHLGLGFFEEAVLTLERAARIRDATEKTPMRLAEVHFALARALREGRGEHERARALAEQARREYAESPATPATKMDLAELDRWLAEG